jgi:hypothetical protein
MALELALLFVLLGLAPLQLEPARRQLLLEEARYAVEVAGDHASEAELLTAGVLRVGQHEAVRQRELVGQVGGPVDAPSLVGARGQIGGSGSIGVASATTCRECQGEQQPDSREGRYPGTPAELKNVSSSPIEFGGPAKLCASTR